MFTIAFVTALALVQVEPHRSSFDLSPLEAVLYDERPDGSVYAVGKSYKIVVENGVAAYVPKFGKCAPKNLPLTFGSKPAKSVVRTGDRITLDRGDMLEIYDLSPDEVEQSFVLKSQAAFEGSTVRIPLESDLAISSTAANGLRFDAPGLGSVVYGNATLVDAHGSRTSVAPRVVGDSLRFDVPVEFAETATFPITIDPIISTIAVDTGTDDLRDMSVAFNEAFDTYLVVYTDNTTALDGDILSRRFDASGALLDAVLINGSTEDSDLPSVASSAGQFLTAWQDAKPNFSTRIRARSRNAGNTSQGAIFDVSAALDGNVASASVGGSAGATAKFLVCFDEITLFINEDIKARLCDAAGPVANEFVLAQHSLIPSLSLVKPAVTKTSGPGGKWAVAYTAFSSTDGDVRVKFVDESGAIVGPEIFAAATSDEELDASIAGDGTDWYLTYTRTVGGNDEIFGRHLHDDGTIHAVGNSVDLTAIETPATMGLSQTGSQIAFDGTRYTYAYLEPSGVAKDVRAATLLIPPQGSTPTFIEKHVVVSSSAADDVKVALAAPKKSSLSGNLFLAWQQVNTSTDHDILGALYSNVGPGGVTVVQTGCGTPEPTFSAGTSKPVIGADFTILLSGFSNAMLIAGLPTFVNLCPGQGGCSLGATTLSITPVPATGLLTFTIPVEPTLFGSTVALQGLDLLPPNAIGSLCGPPKFTQKFRTSDTLDLKFQ